MNNFKRSRMTPKPPMTSVPMMTPMNPTHSVPMMPPTPQMTSMPMMPPMPPTPQMTSMPMMTSTPPTPPMTSVPMMPPMPPTPQMTSMIPTPPMTPMTSPSMMPPTNSMPSALPMTAPMTSPSMIPPMNSIRESYIGESISITDPPVTDPTLSTYDYNLSEYRKYINKIEKRGVAYVENIENSFPSNYAKCFKQNPIRMHNEYKTCVFSAIMEVIFNCESVNMKPDETYENVSLLYKGLQNSTSQIISMLKSIIDKYSLNATCQVLEENPTYNKFTKPVIFIVRSPVVKNVHPKLQNDYYLTGLVYTCTEPLPRSKVLETHYISCHAVSLIRQTNDNWLLYSNDLRPIATHIPTTYSIINNMTHFMPVILRYEKIDFSQGIAFHE